MKHVTNFPLYDGCLKPYGSMEGVVADCNELGIDGLEVIWDHMPYTEELPPAGLSIGYHLMFWSQWVDFYRGDEQALMREFGDMDLVRDYYHGDTDDDMVALYKTDLQRAIDLGSEYVVFHVSEVSLEECFTYKFVHSDEEVIDAAAELVNRLLDGTDAKMAFLLENQWWPGLRFTDPALTKRLLDQVEYGNKGIMLDTGHLLHTNTSLRTQAQAAQYVRDCYDAHVEAGLGDAIRGLHLQQSLSGAYVEEAGYKIPEGFFEIENYWDRYSKTYGHILQIDRHEPWTDPAIAEVVRHIAPEWVNHELSSWPREAHKEAVATQLAALKA